MLKLMILSRIELSRSLSKIKKINYYFLQSTNSYICMIYMHYGGCYLYISIKSLTIGIIISVNRNPPPFSRKSLKTPLEKN